MDKGRVRGTRLQMEILYGLMVREAKMRLGISDIDGEEH